MYYTQQVNNVAVKRISLLQKFIHCQMVNAWQIFL